MKDLNRWLWRGSALLGLLALAGLAAGCDDDDYRHTPPPGQGTLVVDNLTSERVRVYIDGERMENVGAGDHRYYDLEPGVSRVALDGSDTDRSWAGDVDVLESRRTVLEVRGDSYDTYDVRGYFD